MSARVDLVFSHEYEVELVAELPGGSGGRRFYYPGAKDAGGSDGLLLGVTPSFGAPWLGIFALEDVAGLSGVFSGPGRDSD